MYACSFGHAHASNVFKSLEKPLPSFAERPGQTMQKISCSPDIRERIPALKLGLLSASGIKVQRDDSRFSAALEELTAYIKTTFAQKPLAEHHVVSAVRRMYRQIGWEPTKYRPSSEALARRVLKDKGLYRVNNVVDLANIVSAKSHLPMGLYDTGKIKGAVIVDVGKEDETYQGISKESIRATGKIILRDNLGVFGNPTADSRRTSIGTDTGELLALFFCPATVEDMVLNDALGQLTEFYHPLSVTGNIESDIQKF